MKNHYTTGVGLNEETNRIVEGTDIVCNVVQIQIEIQI